MRKIIIVIAILVLTTNVKAQEWVTNFEDAKELAIEQDKTIVMSFQGSDWCAPCIKLEKEFFSTQEFEVYAKEHFILLKVDFPRKKANRLSKEQAKHNSGLAEKYNRQGIFPLVVVLNKESRVLNKISYKEGISVETFIKKLTTK